jgi:outer membrane receptor protein involved in Fe transport
LQILNYQSLKERAYALLNGRVTLAQDADKGWQLSAAVLNLTNKRYRVDGFATSINFGNDVGSYNVRRTFEVGARFEF